MRLHAGCIVLAICLLCGAAPLPARTASAHAGLSPRVAPPRWTPVGPTAGYVLALASSAQTLYAAGVGGAAGPPNPPNPPRPPPPPRPPAPPRPLFCVKLCVTRTLTLSVVD